MKELPDGHKYHRQSLRLSKFTHDVNLLLISWRRGLRRTLLSAFFFGANFGRVMNMLIGMDDMD